MTIVSLYVVYEISYQESTTTAGDSEGSGACQVPMREARCLLSMASSVVPSLQPSTGKSHPGV